MTISSRWLASLLVVAHVAVSGHAMAQASEPTAADLESARELYRDGKDLRQKGDLRGALERFKAAHRYGQTPVTGIELGKTHLQLGELVEAREIFLSIARIKVASDETEKSASARNEAAELAEQIRPRIPTIVVKVSGVKPDASPQVAIDGANAPTVALSAMRKINPGEHAVVVRAGGREEKQAVTLGEGETKEVAITFTDASPKITGESDGGKAAEGAPGPGQGRSIHVVTWIGLGVGAAGLALGSITGILALGKAGNVGDACRDLSCPPSAKSDVDDGRAVANISTVGFAIAGAGLVTAAIGYFVLSPKGGRAGSIETRPGLRVALTPTWGGLHGSF
jgi:hypothetical protein